MNYEEPAFFLITSQRGWPLNNDNPGGEFVVSHGRRINNLSYSDDDSAILTFYETGETAEIVGFPQKKGTVVLCVRINATWVILQQAFVAVVKRVLDTITVDDRLEAITYETGVVTDLGQIEVTPDIDDHYPYTLELITTGNHKSELDGMYQLISRFNGKKERRDHTTSIRLTSNLIRKPGATLVLTHEGVLVNDEVKTKYTLTVSHSLITTTIYEGTARQLTKITGDDSLPPDVWISFKLEANMPLWFELNADCSYDGLYTLWPDYYDRVTDLDLAESKGYFHRSDGSRSTLNYHMEFSDVANQFTIDATDFKYTLELVNFSVENGARMTFNLSENNTDCDLPETIEVRRAQTSYSRAVMLELQI